VYFGEKNFRGMGANVGRETQRRKEKVSNITRRFDNGPAAGLA
jgi:hypothetical protein